MPFYEFVGSNMEPSRNVKVAVGLSNVQLAERRTETTPRRVIIIRNTSSNAADIITIHQGDGTATADLGVVLRQYEAYTDATDAGYQCWQGTINAICATANGQVSIFER